MIRLVLLVLALGLVAAYVLPLIARRRSEWIAQVRSAFLTHTPVPRAHGPSLKDVALRGGGVRLRVPRHWSEEYPDDDHAVFRDPARPERLLALAHTVAPRGAGGLRDALSTQIEATATAFDDLPTGLSLLKELRATRERAQDVIVFRWLLAGALPGERVGIATFSFTVPTAAARDPLTWDDVALLELEIRATRLGAD